MIPVCKPWLPGKEKEYVDNAMETNWISSSGEYIERFEDLFSKYCGVKYGVSCSSGYGALHLACSAIGLKEGDEVIVPTFTMIAPINAVILTGARPVLIDSDPKTFCIDANKIEERINKNTKAIMAVHVYGHPCDMDKINGLAKKYDLKVIEDTAEAHGAEYKGVKCGGLSDVSCFSFYANKVLTTGEGGMCLTNDLRLAEEMKKLRNHYLGVPRFTHEKIGFNYRLTNLQAAIGVAQTENAEMLVESRRNVGLKYNEFLKNTGKIILPEEEDYAKNVYWMYGVVLKDHAHLSKEEVMGKLKEKGVETRSFFVPMHKQKVFLEGIKENYPDCSGSFPVAEKISERGFYLPSSSNLPDKEIKFICDSLKEILNGV